MQLPWFDSHAHFDIADIADPIERACNAGLAGILAVGGSEELNYAALEAARAAPDFVSLSLGWDRSQAEVITPAQVREQLVAESGHCHQNGIKLAAIGETGLDYHYESDTAPAQRRLFESQVELAGELGLPVVVHSREADADTLAILRNSGSAALASKGRLGVLHCFTGDREFAEKLLELGLCISFSGIVTFRNADPLREVARMIPGARLLVETDSPYLAPVPLRGRTNEPAFVSHVGQCLADVRNETPESLAHQTTENARHLFGL